MRQAHIILKFRQHVPERLHSLRLYYLYPVLYRVPRGLRALQVTFGSLYEFFWCQVCHYPLLVMLSGPLLTGLLSGGTGQTPLRSPESTAGGVTAFS
jgi:hypothetical protein